MANDQRGRDRRQRRDLRPIDGGAHRDPVQPRAVDQLGLQAIIRRADGAESQPFALQGVAAQIVLALITHQAEINGYGKGSLQFDWGPNGLQGRVHPMWDHTIAPALLQQFAAALVQPHVRPYRSGWVRFDEDALYLRGTEELPRAPDPGA